MSESIQLAALVSRDRLPAEIGGVIHLLVQVRAPERPPTAEQPVEAESAGGGGGQAGEGGGGEGADTGPARLPLNVAAVLDRSGSMAGAKLSYTKRAASFLVDQVSGGDYLSIVTYDDEVAVLQRTAHISNKDLLKGQVQDVRVGGTTNLSGGMLAGVREVKKNAGKGLVNRVLLLTDGLANIGITSRDALVEKARQIREKGVLLTTLGVGADFDEDLLTAMAEAGGGNFYYIETPDRIPQIFGQELQGLLAVAGQALAVRVKADDGVTIRGVLGYPPNAVDGPGGGGRGGASTDGEHGGAFTGGGPDSGGPEAVEMELPDIYAGETKSLVLELHVAPGAVGTRKWIRVDLSYEDVLGAGTVVGEGSPGGRYLGGEVQVRVEVPISLVDRDSLGEVAENPTVVREARLARSAEAMDEAIALGDQHDYLRGSAVLEEMIAALEPLADGDEAIAAQVLTLREKAAEYKAGHFDASSRKQMRAMSHQNRSSRRPPPQT